MRGVAEKPLHRARGRGLERGSNPVTSEYLSGFRITQFVTESALREADAVIYRPVSMVTVPLLTAAESAA